MIRRSDDMEKEVRNNMRGGNGSVELTGLLKVDEFHNKGRLFSRMVLKPGVSIGMHQHVGDFETFYILSGEATIDDGKNKSIVKAGDVIYTDDGESHSLANTGKEDLELIALVLYA